MTGEEVNRKSEVLRKRQIRSKQTNLALLVKSKEIFYSFVEKHYERERDFPNSAYYFHKRVLEMIRTKDYDALFRDKLFLEFVYATLAAWGMDRMDGKARLVKFDVFEKSILNNLDAVKYLSKYKLNEMNDEEKEEVKGRLSILFENLKVMETIELVGVSKAMHHLLPDLVPPIDRKHVLEFFYGNTNYNRKNQKEKFLEIFDKVYFMCKELDLKESDLRKEWDTSIPKLIDNAIIGFISTQGMTRKSSKARKWDMILDKLLEIRKPFSAKEIANKVGEKNVGLMRVHLNKWVDEGILHRVYEKGRYWYATRKVINEK